MQLIHGTAVQLGVKTKTSEDGFGAPIYETEFVTVEEVRSIGGVRRWR